MLIAIVHNSDRIITAFHALTEEELLDKILEDKWVTQDLEDRLFDDLPCREGELKTLLKKDFHLIFELFHDGDSEQGYTLIEKP